MRKKIQRYIAILLCIMSLVILITPSICLDNIFAVTHNVVQSRRIANIDEFPLSYQDGLSRVKETYPNAMFVYYDTGLDWYGDLLTTANELSYGRNLISSSSPSSWKSEDAYDKSTNTYKEVEPGWCQASNEVIQYYMDPRNFFTPNRIFQFMSLSYNDSQTVEGVQAILSGTFMGNKTIADNNGASITYAEVFYQIGKDVGVSPYLLACRAKQEQGTGRSAMISGNYSAVPGYYNYFNIKATGSTTSEILTNGLKYAKSRGWSTPYKSIYGGAKVLASSYVNSGIDCLYLQHWNVVAKEGTVSYLPYMTSTQAPYYEAISLSKACSSVEAPYVFVIPVYQNMPEIPCTLPDDNGAENCLLKNLTLNNGNIDIGEFSPHKNTYNVVVDSKTNYVEIKAQAYSNDATFSLNGTPIDVSNSQALDKAIVLGDGFNDIIITVTSKSGLSKNYSMNILKDDGEIYYRSPLAEFNEKETIVQPGVTVEALLDDIQFVNCSFMITYNNGIQKGYGVECATEDMLTIFNNDDVIIYQSPIIVRGDVDNDGLITNNDIEIIKSHILERTTLSEIAQKATDVDDDGEITARDMGIIKGSMSTKSNKYNPEISVEIIVDKTIRTKNVIKLNASNGTYCTDGYLVYDENKIDVDNTDNSGMIHFVIDGSQVTFDNGLDYIEFSSVFPIDNVDFGIIFEQAYDYTENQYISITTEQKGISLVNSELGVSAKYKKPWIGEKYIELTLTNTSSYDMTDFNVNFDQFLISDKNEDYPNDNILKVGDSRQYKLYPQQDLEDNLYYSNINTSYTRSDGVKNSGSTCVEFKVLKSTLKSVNIYSHSNCTKRNNGTGHAYVYAINNDATLKTSMTATGVCSFCGKENIKIVDGTRKSPIEEVNIQISSAFTNQTKLPEIVSLTRAAKVSDVVWTDKDGIVLDINSQDFTLVNNETYVLSKLVLKSNDVHAFDKDTVIYINNCKFIAQMEITENTITLINVGQFKF